MESQGAGLQRQTLTAPVTHETVAGPIQWKLLTRVTFRFVFSYFVVYNVGTFIDLFPFTDTIGEKYESLWQHIVPWTGNHVLHLASPITIFTNGSGDTTYDYVRLFTLLVIAVVTALVWSILDRQRPNYRVLHQWFFLLMRIALGATMVSYGAVKVIKSQFPDPSLARLLQPYGDSSPMGLLWTFMGASKVYNIFTGGVEVSGGLLLFIPRLTTLGSLVSLGALANIFMLNMSYDVPVKLYSFHLLIMAGILAAPNLQRLVAFLVLQQKVQLEIYSPHFRRKWANRASFALQFLLIGFSTVISFIHAHEAYTSDNSRPALYGIWSVDEFYRNGQILPVNAMDSDRWYRLVIDNFEVSLLSQDGRRDRYRSKFDLPGKKITFIKRDDPAHTADFLFSNPQADHLTLEGDWEGRHISAKLHRTEPPQFLLNTRGFHWINEYPYNH